MKNSDGIVSDKLSEKQILQQARKQIEFLRVIYPFLTSESYNTECVELRAIKRLQDTQFVKSCNLWRLDNKGTKEQLKFLKAINGQAVCAYYSSFTFDYSKDCNKDDGSKYMKGFVNNQNTLYTQILAMDFDNVTEKEHERQMQIINEHLGIETITVFTGHGYQEIILLEDKVYDKDIFQKFTHVLLSKGFSVDDKIIDSARVLRLPYTFNCKSFDSNSKHYSLFPIPIPTRVLKFTKKRYPVRLVFQKLLQLDTVRPEYKNYKNLEALFGDTNDFLDACNIKTHCGNNNAFKTDLGVYVKFLNVKDDYYMIDFEILPDAIKNMLIETPEGLRNSVMFFLVPFFKNYLNIPLHKIMLIMKTWGKKCKPPLDDTFISEEVVRLFSYNTKGTGAYTQELAKQFGYIDFTGISSDNKIFLPNEFILTYAELSDCSVKTFLMMKLFEKVEGITEWTDKEIEKVARISHRTWFRAKKDLLNYGFIYKKVTKKESGSKYCYYINHVFNKSLGFTKLNTATLENMVYNSKRQLNDAEIKLYTFMQYMLYNNNNETCWASQQYLADRIGKARNTLVSITDSLHNKNYIKKDSYKDNQGLPHCLYTLSY